MASQSLRRPQYGCSWPADTGLNQSGASEDGYAAVDALVALTILASTLLLAIGASSVAEHASATAAEEQRAGDLMQFLVETPGASAEVHTGRTNDFEWVVEVTRETAPVAGLAICAHRVALTNRASGRRYSLHSAAFCGASWAS